MRVVCYSLVISIFIACSAGEISDYEYISTKEGIKLEVEAFPKVFNLEHGQDAISWERLYTFNRFYIKSKNPITSTMQHIAISSDNYIYIVQRKYLNKAVQYKVECLDRKKEQETVQSDLNARNLSRFLASGQFERDLLAL